MGRIWQIYARSNARHSARELRNSRAAYRGFGVGSVHAWITAAMRHKATGGIIAFLSALGFVACVLILWRAT